MNVRSSGILLHPSSLPSAHGIGDLGPSAFRFADFLEKTSQRFWQVLPLNPTEGDHAHSPYYSTSAFAGNPLLISPEILVQQGLLKKAETGPIPSWPAARIAFGRVVRYKRRLLQRVCERFDTRGDRTDYERFCHEAGWLDDVALHRTLRSHFQSRPWIRWPPALRNREPEALRAARQTFREQVRSEKIIQYLFFRQWADLKRYCNRRQVRLIGDMPIYTPLDSVDVWTHPEFFKLTRTGRPAALSGVPPDYFSKTGQLWGHPVYDWDALRSEGYSWWVERVSHHLQLYDLTRIDHFRGLVAYWEVPARARTAVNGHWVPVPVEDFFSRLIKRFGPLPVIAEDLGTISADVREVIRCYGFPGMRVLLFAFGDDFPNGSFLPHRHEPNCVVYTGTHDNNTVRGWFEREAGPQAKKNLFRYIGREVSATEAPWELIRLAMMSIAKTAIIPLQDVLGLGEEAMMNRPARRRGNWLWRFDENALGSETMDRLKEVTAVYGRI